MEKQMKTILIAEDFASAAELVASVKSLSAKICCILPEGCTKPEGIEELWQLDDPQQHSFVEYLPALEQMFRREQPDVVIAQANRNCRLAAAHAAVVLGSAVLGDAQDLEMQDMCVLARRMAYGGAALRWERLPYPAVLCLSHGAYSGDGIGQAAPAQTIHITAAHSSVCRVEKRPRQEQRVDLSAAKCIVAAGRGFRKEEMLELAQELAGVLGAELACSRPLAEEMKWLPSARFIGLSGQIVQPDAYIAVGISGQVQHMVGANRSRTIFAVNKDKNAPVFGLCDYGIVGDLETVLPSLSSLLKK